MASRGCYVRFVSDTGFLQERLAPTLAQRQR